MCRLPKLKARISKLANDFALYYWSRFTRKNQNISNHCLTVSFFIWITENPNKPKWYSTIDVQKPLKEIIISRILHKRRSNSEQPVSEVPGYPFHSWSQIEGLLQQPSDQIEKHVISTLATKQPKHQWRKCTSCIKIQDSTSFDMYSNTCFGRSLPLPQQIEHQTCRAKLCKLAYRNKDGTKSQNSTKNQTWEQS